MAVLATWLLVMCLVASLFFLPEHLFTLVAVVIGYFVPVLIMVVSYMVVGSVARKHAKDITKVEKTAARLQQHDSHGTHFLEATSVD